MDLTEVSMALYTKKKLAVIYNYEVIYLEGSTKDESLCLEKKYLRSHNSVNLQMPNWCYLKINA